MRYFKNKINSKVNDMRMFKTKEIMQNEKGFTLIELVMVIVILAVLAAVAIPTFVNLSTEARNAARLGVVGGIRSGITTYFIDTTRGNRTTYPSALDAHASAAACTSVAPCFGTVLSQGGITSDWTKATATTYTGPGGTTYTYTSASGTFS
jgi:MSHA pilin protein MshA